VDGANQGDLINLFMDYETLENINGKIQVFLIFLDISLVSLNHNHMDLLLLESNKSISAVGGN